VFLRCFGQEEAKIAAGRPSRSAKTFYIEVRHFPGGSSRPLTIFTMALLSLAVSAPDAEVGVKRSR
jgi:hypothetical protein